MATMVSTWICCSCRSRRRPSSAEGHSAPGKPLQEPRNHPQKEKKISACQYIIHLLHWIKSLSNKNMDWIKLQWEPGTSRPRVGRWDSCQDAPVSPEQRNGIITPNNTWRYTVLSEISRNHKAFAVFGARNRKIQQKRQRARKPGHGGAED